MPNIIYLWEEGFHKYTKGLNLCIVNRETVLQGKIIMSTGDG